MARATIFRSDDRKFSEGWQPGGTGRYVGLRNPGGRTGNREGHEDGDDPVAREVTVVCGIPVGAPVTARTMALSGKVAKPVVR